MYWFTCRSHAVEFAQECTVPIAASRSCCWVTTAAGQTRRGFAA